MTTSEIGAVTALWRYPVSSLGGERASSLQIAPSGVAGDRSHALVDAETGQTINPAQRQWQFAPQVLSRLGPDGEPELSLDGRRWLPGDAAECQAALTSGFGRAVRLHRYGTGLGTSAVSHRYQLSPLHLISLQAIAALRRRIPGAHVDERRFRPNVVVDFSGAAGDPPPEYSLIGREFRLGNLRLRGVSKAGRCSFTTLQQLGLPEDRAVLQTLIAGYERDFGIYCEILDEGLLSTGDRLMLDDGAQPVGPVVIVGAGQAGGTAARALREFGYGGEIRLFGDETRTPYERPPLSKSLIATEPARLPLTQVLSPDEASRLDVQMHLGESVVGIDRVARTVEVRGGARYPYGRLILATGGAAKVIPQTSRGYGRVLTLRSADDAEALSRGLSDATSIFVLGGGWLGLEVAAAARARRLDVTLFARQKRLCSRVLPPVVADVVAALHQHHGTRLVLGCAPRFTETADHVEAAVDGRVERADLLVVAIGMVPNDALARQAGLDCDDGIVTDENGATSDPHIWAIGDVSRQRSAEVPRGLRLESWQNASEQPVRAICRLLQLEVPAPPLPRFWSDQFGQKIQIAGLPDPNSVPQSPAVAGVQFWDFGAFAIGINQPALVHKFAIGQRAEDHADAEPTVHDGAEAGSARVVKHPFPAVGDLAERELRRLTFDPLGDLVVTRVGAEVFALPETCPHANASLAEGLIEGHRIICPLHFAEFDLRDGRAYNAPKGCPRARTYRITEEDGTSWIWLPAA